MENFAQVGGHEPIIECLWDRVQASCRNLKYYVGTMRPDLSPERPGVRAVMYIFCSSKV